MSRLRVLAIALLLLGAAAAAARWLVPRLAHEPPLPVLEVLGGEFALPSTIGRRAKLADFRGRLVLLNFGFTSCPDVCPTVLSRMRQALIDLGDEAAQVQPLFVTIDPERDTLEKLGPYVTFFHPAFVAMSGSPAETRAVAELFKVYYEREDDAVIGYGFSHSDQIYLIDREGRVRATFASNVRNADMVATIRRLIAE
jgi:protein SCO1/2